MSDVNSHVNNMIDCNKCKARDGRCIVDWKLTRNAIRAENEMSDANSHVNNMIDCNKCKARDGRCIVDWKLTRNAIRAENELIGQRVNWLPVWQGLFGVIFGFCLKDIGKILSLLTQTHLSVLMPQAEDYYLLFVLFAVALFAFLYSSIIYITVRAATMHIHSLEGWWNTRYNADEWEPKWFDDLKLMHPLNDVGDILTNGRKLIIVAAVNNVLHFRIFDSNGKKVVDIDEKKKRLIKQAQEIEDLRKQLESLWPPHVLTTSEKCKVVSAVVSIVKHILPKDYAQILSDRDFLPCPPINGISTRPIYRNVTSDLLPLTFAYVWAQLLWVAIITAAALYWYQHSHHPVPSLLPGGLTLIGVLAIFIWLIGVLVITWATYHEYRSDRILEGNGRPKSKSPIQMRCVRMKPRRDTIQRRGLKPWVVRTVRRSNRALAGRQLIVEH